jgi:O-antigen ligase
MVLGIPFSHYPGRSFHAVFLEQSANVFLFALFYALIDSTEKLKRLLFFAVAGAGLYSLICLAKGNMTNQRLFFGAMFDPNDLAFFALTFLPFGFIFLTGETRLRRLLSLASLFSCAVLIIYTNSRGGFVALGLVCLLMLISGGRTIRSWMKGVLLIAAVPCLLFMLLGGGASRYSTLLNPKADYNYYDETGRLAIWGKGIDLMVSNPVLGVGVGCFEEAIGEQRKVLGLPPRWQSPHNAFIQVGAETGVLGLGLFVAMIVSALAGFRRAKREAPSEDLAKVAEMGFVGLIGQIASIMFLSQAYSPYWVFYMAMPFVLLRLAVLEKQEAQTCS